MTGRRKLSALTPTICAMMNIERPSLSEQNALETVVEGAKMKGVERINKCLVFAPDAVGERLRQMHKPSFERVLRHAPLEISLASVLPTLTPVCFASMFTGAPPESHGIREYEKPVLSCETIFDAIVKAGKRAAIVAVRDSSIDLIFRNRDIDYLSENCDEEVTARAVSLLESDAHDFILAYQQEYDDVLHETSPWSGDAVRAMENHISAFDRIACAFDSSWNRYDRAIIFAPDHGAHLDRETGKGSHGTNCRDDVFVRHFYGFRKKHV